MNRFSFTYFPFNLINKRLKKKIIKKKKSLENFSDTLAFFGVNQAFIV